VEPNIFDFCTQQYASIAASFQHNAVLQDNDYPHVDISPHDAITTTVAVDASIPAACLKLDAYPVQLAELLFHLRSQLADLGTVVVAETVFVELEDVALSRAVGPLVVVAVAATASPLLSLD
jgi:hypothetical protein